MNFLDPALRGFLAEAGMPYTHGSIWLAAAFWVMVAAGFALLGMALGWAGWWLWWRRQARTVVRTAEVIAERAVKRR